MPQVLWPKSDMPPASRQLTETCRDTATPVLQVHPWVAGIVGAALVTGGEVAVSSPPSLDGSVKTAEPEGGGITTSAPRVWIAGAEVVTIGCVSGASIPAGRTLPSLFKTRSGASPVAMYQRVSRGGPDRWG